MKNVADRDVLDAMKEEDEIRQDVESAPGFGSASDEGHYDYMEYLAKEQEEAMQNGLGWRPGSGKVSPKEPCDDWAYYDGNPPWDDNAVCEFPGNTCGDCAINVVCTETTHGTNYRSSAKLNCRDWCLSDDACDVAGKEK